MDESTPRATDGTINPNPMLMILGNMGQSAHANRPYAGNLHGSYEFVPESREHALKWMRENRPNDKATLIEIRCIEILDPNEETPTTEEILEAEGLPSEEALDAEAKILGTA